MSQIFVLFLGLVKIWNISTGKPGFAHGVFFLIRQGENYMRVVIVY